MPEESPTSALDHRGLPVGYLFKPDWEITPRAVRERAERGEFAGPVERSRAVLLDCRRPDEWSRCRIEGALHIPMNELEQRADELEDEASGRSRPIVVYCHHGVRSVRVTATLRGLGFTDVRSMAGGIELWAMDVDRSVPRY